MALDNTLMTMKHFKSRLFWFLFLLGYGIWAIDYFFISKPDDFWDDFIPFSIGNFVSTWLIDVFARKSMPNSKSWLNNPID
jgi:hypothetical protein